MCAAEDAKADVDDEGGDEDGDENNGYLGWG